ncbi:DUF924 family protein [Synechococcus sp. BA-132 BA5]|uniref:DUF924 family protein n=1 Tax=Synechococcus sp. BA-132 BA5 TaxID=3110252 RepID=UPI002B1E931F|nr:DUF924 family protein [Synechococcus sp. BA-132 BA5]MEA5417155.1 DUF924 family protein [Synechococcus sp. BA-132 BA5]
MPGQGEQAAEVLEFWFAETQPRQWFDTDPASDEVLRQRSLGLIRRTADFARRQRDVIARFGCFPHRNAAMGRVSSAEELAFLQTPGSRLCSGW